MDISNEEKQRAMDAMSHRETATQLRAFKGRHATLGRAVAGPGPAPARDSLIADVKRKAMDAITNVQTVAQVGAIKVTGGIALYAAHIRQMDTRTRPQQRTIAIQPNRLEMER